MSMMDKQNLMFSRISLFFYFLCPWWINKIQCKTFYVYFMSMKGKSEKHCMSMMGNMKGKKGKTWRGMEKHCMSMMGKKGKSMKGNG